MATSALAQFIEGLEEVDELLSASPNQTAETGRHNAFMRAGVVLLVAHFEGFLKSISEEHIDWLSDGSRASRDIPRNLRELYTLPLLKEITESSDRTQRWALLKKIEDWRHLWMDDAKPNKGLLDPTTLSRQVTSARPHVIDALFQLMGCNAVCDGEIDYTTDDEPRSLNIRLALNDAVSCRNDIAHGDASRVPTREDVERYSAFLKALAHRLDRKCMDLRLPA